MDYRDHLKHLLMQQLESLRASGVQTLPKGAGKIVLPELQSTEVAQPTPVSPSEPARATVATRPASPVSAPPVPAARNMFENKAEYGPAIAAPDRQSALDVIQAEVAGCRACKELCDSRKQTVFGVGNPNARLCFVGEGPGADEDRLGEPFVGAAGQLLNKIIAACKMSRDDVYILNTVKCRPPGNRNPQEEELDNCWPYAIRQLEVIQPEFICCLGSVAARTVLRTKSSISKLRGQFHSFRGSRVVVTYHPAYLLRTPSAKKHTWNDMKMLLAEMGIQL